MTPLHYACQKNELECVRFLCEVANFNPNEVETGTYTCLHWAAAKGRTEIVRYLLSSTRADPTLKTMVIFLFSLGCWLKGLFSV
jgi:ankyrin repeat protein